ncbi:MAG: adenine methyltransferase [Desulfocapsa sp.]|nr:MAG: adenine methyltransferase [Desulfocapsa sp.]
MQNPFPNKKYKIIYADPPWTYKVWSDKGTGRSASQHYDLLTKEEIQNLPVQDLAAASSVLFLWVTYPTLPEGLELMKKWGFTYKTCAFTWVKKNTKADSIFMGLGYYTRSNAEICLLGTRGDILKRHSKGVPQVILEKRREHSRKPDTARDRIVELFGDVPRIELFAREKSKGWDAWGNEVDKF